MNILIDEVPRSVFIDNVEYEINSDFRISILFELMMQDNSIDNDERVATALELYYPEIPRDWVQGIQAILWFYRCGRDIEEESQGRGSNKKADAIYSFEHDDEYIYAAFLDQYGIDLQDIEYLHWWKFRAMFKGLKEDNKISKIMGYRSITINDDMTDSEKKYYREMKKIYALPDNRTQQEKEEDFYNVIASMV